MYLPTSLPISSSSLFLPRYSLFFLTNSILSLVHDSFTLSSILFYTFLTCSSFTLLSLSLFPFPTLSLSLSLSFSLYFLHFQNLTLSNLILTLTSLSFLVVSIPLPYLPIYKGRNLAFTKTAL